MALGNTNPGGVGGRSRLYHTALNLYFMKTRVSTFSGRSDYWIFRIDYSILNSLSGTVEVGVGLGKTPETELRRLYFVTFCFQMGNEFFQMLLLLNFIKSLKLSPCLLSLSCTLILTKAVLRALRVSKNGAQQLTGFLFGFIL